MSPAESAALLAGCGAVDLVSTSARGLDATMVPIVYEPGVGEHGRLLAHLSRVNPQWRDVADEVLVIAHGPDHFVSADWQPSPTAVGTWNYETVHAYGDLVVHDDIDFCRDVVRAVAAKHEPRWRYDDVDPAAMDLMLRAVVGVEIRLTRVVGKAKLSQNKHPDVIRSIMAGLAENGRPDGAALLAERSLPVAEARQACVDEIAERHRAGR